MSRLLQSSLCCIAGCSRPVVDDGSCPLDEGLCAPHVGAASPRLRARLQTAIRRRDRLESVWADPRRYEAVVETGRYLKLCDATQAVLDQTDSAWMRVKLDIVLAEANRKPQPGSNYGSEAPAAQAR